MKKQISNEKINNNDIKKLISEINSLTKAINKNNELILKQQKEEKQSIISNETKSKPKKRLFEKIKNFFKKIIIYPKEILETIESLFISEEDISQQDASKTIKFLLMKLFGIIQILGYFLAICFLIIPFIFKEIKLYTPLCISGSFVIFIFAQISRISKLSIAKITDTNQLTGLLSAFAAFLALIVSLISLMK